MSEPVERSIAFAGTLVEAAIDAIDWYANGSQAVKAILWAFIAKLYRKLELELPEDTCAMFDTWLRESELQKEAIRVALQVRLNTYRISSKAKGAAETEAGTPCAYSPGEENYRRDLKIYELKKLGKKNSEIIKAIDDECHKNQWDLISEKHVATCLNRIEEFAQLERLPRNPGGRPRAQKTSRTSR